MPTDSPCMNLEGQHLTRARRPRSWNFFSITNGTAPRMGGEDRAPAAPQPVIEHADLAELVEADRAALVPAAVSAHPSASCTGREVRHQRSTIAVACFLGVSGRCAPISMPM